MKRPRFGRENNRGETRRRGQPRGKGRRGPTDGRECRASRGRGGKWRGGAFRSVGRVRRSARGSSLGGKKRATFGVGGKSGGGAVRAWWCRPREQCHPLGERGGRRARRRQDGPARHPGVRDDAAGRGGGGGVGADGRRDSRSARGGAGCGDGRGGLVGGS